MLRIAILVVAALGSPILAQEARFISLGPNTSASDVSADGTVVVGSRGTPNGTTLFRWTEAGGPVDIGLGHSPKISADGTVITARTSSGFVRWTEQTGLVTIDVGTVTGISGDGSTLVGYHQWPIRGFRWTQAGGTQILPFPAGVSVGEHKAWAVSGDGNVVVGTLVTTGRVEPFRWSQATGMVGLGRVPGGQWDSNASVITPEGSVIFGATRTSHGYDTYRWTEQTGMVALGVAGGGFHFPNPLDATSDGEILVGDTAMSAFVWRMGAGPKFVHDVLEQRFGLDLGAHELTQARGISANGRVIVGSSFNSAINDNVGWIAVLNGPIPAPGSVLFVIAGALMTTRRRRGPRN